MNLDFTKEPLIHSTMDQTFYVDATNGDDNNNGSSTNPFKTIKKACDSVPVGGVGLIYLINGQTYNMPIDKDIMLKNKIIEVKNKECFTTSKIVADKLEVPHKVLVKTIDKILLKSSGTTVPLKFSQKFVETTFINTQKAKYRWFFINEPWFSKLVMNLSRYKKAEIIQNEFIEAFFKMKEVLNNQSNASWLEKREQGKLTRQAETDVIKEFVDYATKQWSKSAKLYYMNITKLTNKALELLIQVKWWTPIRDLVSINQLWIISSLDDRAMKAIQDWMDQELPYKYIYTYAKEEVNKLAEALDFTPKNKIWTT